MDQVFASTDIMQKTISVEIRWLIPTLRDTLFVRCKYFNGFKREVFDRNTLSCFPDQKKNYLGLPEA